VREGRSLEVLVVDWKDDFGQREAGDRELKKCARAF
jgi:hypothetical protein